MSSTIQLDRLKAKQTKLAARIQALEARTKVSQRKQDTRRKILIGSYYLDHARKNNKMHEIEKLMDHYLTRDSDRKLFNLSLKNPKEKNIKNNKKEKKES